MNPSFARPDLIYRALFDDMHDAVLVFDLDGVCLMTNRRAAALLRYEPDELPGKTILDLVASEEHEDCLRTLAALREGNAVPVTERSYRAKTGARLPVEANTVLVRDDWEQPLYVVSIAHDISERKAREQALQLAQQLTRAIPGILAVFDLAEQRRVYVNQDVIQKLGYTFEMVESLGDDLVERLFAPDDLPAMQAHMAQLSSLADGEILEHEFRVRDVNSGWRWINTRNSVFTRDADGKPRQIIGIIQDITAQKEKDEELRHKTERLRAIAESSPDTLFIKDAGGRYLLINPADAQKLGRTPEDIVGKTDEELFGAAWAATNHETDSEVMASGQPQTYERRSRTGDSEVVWLITKAPYYSTQGDVRGVIGFARDITQRKHTEDALTAQRKLLRSVIDLIPDFIFAKDLEHRYVLANEAVARASNTTTDAILGKRDTDFIPPELAERYVQADEQVIATGQPQFNIEETLLDQRGARTAITSKVPLRDHSGAVIGIVGVSRDITDLKQVEAALQKSEARYRAIVEDQTEYICRYAPGYILTFVNDAYCRAFGKRRDELVGTSFLQLLPEAEGQYVVDRIASLSLSQPTVTHEHHAVGIDGEERWQQWIERAFFDEHDNIVEYQAVGRDITERKRAEEALRLSETRYRAVVEDQTELIIRHLPDGTVLFVNSAFCRYFHLDRDAFIGQTILKTAPEQARQFIERQLSSLSHDNPVVTGEQMVALLGEVRWLQWTNRAIFDSAGNIAEIQAVGRDITERKELELRNLELTVERERVKILGDFVRDVSHDLRTPLSILSTGVYLLRKITDPQKQAERLDGMDRQLTRLGKLIDQMFTMTRLDSDSEVALMPVDVNEQVSDTVTVCQREALARKLDLRLEIEARALAVVADPSLLHLAFVNLVENMIQFTPEGGSLRVQTSSSGREAVIEFTDTGIGIAAEDLPHIFERFYKADKARSDDSSGAGLGLAIVRKIVDLHRGRIEVESRVGEGSTFRVFLPLDERQPS